MGITCLLSAFRLRVTGSGNLSKRGVVDLPSGGILVHRSEPETRYIATGIMWLEWSKMSGSEK